jgi:nucleoside-diphosphate-sugar epimerase
LKVLVFGASGIVGTWSVVALANSGLDVVAVSQSKGRFTSSQSSNLRQISSASSKWEEILVEEKPDVVLHCDWSGVSGSLKNSADQFTNVERWLKLATRIAELNISKVIYLGSQAEFGTNLYLVNKNTPFSPITSYGQAKVDAFTKLQAFFANTDTKFVWARLFSLYGALDVGNWLIPSMIRELENGNFFQLSSGVQKWNYLHLADVAHALSLLVTNSFEMSSFNVGAKESIQVLKIAECVSMHLGHSELLKVGQTEINSIPEVNPDISDLESLGWSQTIELDLGIRKTIEWHRGLVQKFSEYGFLNITDRLPGRLFLS